jgi:hypothetical protein
MAFLAPLLGMGPKPILSSDAKKCQWASSTSSDEDDSSWVGSNFFELDDPGALRHFVSTATTSSTVATPTTVAMSSRGHDAKSRRLRIVTTCHDQ